MSRDPGGTVERLVLIRRRSSDVAAPGAPLASNAGSAGGVTGGSVFTGRCFRILVIGLVSGLVIAVSGIPAASDRAASPPPAAADPPFFSTFSICAIDTATGQSGVAVTTRVPFVGRAVPWVRAGVGAVATQSWTVVEYGRQGLDLLEAGTAPDDVLDRLLEGDNGREQRQVGLIDMRGRTAAFTGAKCGAWAGSRQGAFYTVQANIMVGPEVVDAVADHFESTAGLGMPLAERLLLAIEAGQKLGGDRRWGNFQSAALRVADPNDPGRGGDHLSTSIDVGEHADPVAEMKRIYYRTSRRLGYRSFSEISGPDVVELHRLLHALGHWRPELAAFPAAPTLTPDLSLLRRDPEALSRAYAAFDSVATAFTAEYGRYGADTRDAVDRFRKEANIDYAGNPPGLVDDRLVEALRAASAARLKSR
jgi:uncharacterized Ntn-hydrolase superfamily protein